MKLGILGTGMIVQQGALQAISEFNLTYVSILGMKESEEETKQLAEKYQLNTYHLDYDEMLNTEIDTVYVALPNYLHYEFSKRALLRGKHVIIEKPITANLDELKELRKIAKEKNLIILEAMSLYYLPAYKKLKEMVNELGNIRIISMNHSQYSSRYEDFKSGKVLPAFDYKKAGGALMDINVYNISGIVGLFGEPQKINYYANIEKGIDTSGILIMDYDLFKAVAIGAKDCKVSSLSTIQGDKGSITIVRAFNGMHSFSYHPNDGETKEFSYQFDKVWLYYEFEEFIKIIDQKEFEKAEEMLNLSYTVCKIMNEARRQEGIVFDNDK